jgi:Ca2+-binding RTX toxin-like protein
MYGNVGRDNFRGDGGNDTLDGAGGSDRLAGGAGQDRLTGGAGGDRLDGGAGKDLLSGNGGTDRFIFLAGDSGKGTKADRITDFGGKDRLDLTGIDADTGRGGEQDLVFTGKTATAHAVWYVRAGDDVIVRIDVDGNTRADMEIRLSDISRLNAGDFV